MSCASQLPEQDLGNIFARPNVGPKGAVVKGHAHHFDHVTVCSYGHIRVSCVLPSGRQVQTDLSTGDYCVIRAGVEHEITFLEDGKFVCFYAHRTPQGEVVQQYTGWPDAYS